MSRNKWSIKEEKELIKLIKKNPYNLSKCFMLFAEKHSTRTSKAASQHWYRVLKYQNTEKPVFTTLSAKELVVNGTRANKKNTISRKDNLWNKIISIFLKKK